MLTDLMGGRLQAASVGAPALLAFIKSGKLRCIARVPRSACRNCLTFRRSQSKVSKGLR